MPVQNGYGQVFQPRPEEGGGLYITTACLGDEVEIMNIDTLSSDFGKKEILDIRDSTEDNMKFNRGKIYPTHFKKKEIEEIFSHPVIAAGVLRDVIFDHTINNLYPR